MRISVYLCLLAAPLLAMLGTALGRRLAPAAATRAATGLAAAAALANTAGLAMIACSGLGRTGEGLRLLGLHTDHLNVDPVPRWFGAAAAALLTAALALLTVLGDAALAFHRITQALLP